MNKEIKNLIYSNLMEIYNHIKYFEHIIFQMYEIFEDFPQQSTKLKHQMVLEIKKIIIKHWEL